MRNNILFYAANSLLAIFIIAIIGIAIWAGYFTGYVWVYDPYALP